MAASTGKKGSKIDFSKSIKDTITTASSPKSSVDQESISLVSDIEKRYAGIKEEIEIKSNDIYKNNINNVNNVNNINNDENLPDKKKIDLDELAKETVQRKKEKGVKCTTFSVSYKIGGEFEKLMLVASEKYGFNRSVYIRKLMLEDYIEHKEEYDQLLERL